MNKLHGFFELKDSSLPAVKWKEFTDITELFNDRLWTVRTSVYSGNDTSLPRKVGVKAEEAMAFAWRTKAKYNDNCMLVYYPFFIALKSGTLSVRNDKIIIEAVTGDLWNLVTDGIKNVTYIYDSKGLKMVKSDGDVYFLNEDEVSKLLKAIPEIRRMFRDDLLENKGALLEWSFACDTDAELNKVGEPYLVFYEAKTII